MLEWLSGKMDESNDCVIPVYLSKEVYGGLWDFSFLESTGTSCLEHTREGITLSSSLVLSMEWGIDTGKKNTEN